MKINDLIQILKEQTRKEALPGIPLLDRDADLLRVLLAWPLAKISIRDREIKQSPSSTRDIWETCWNSIKVDMRDLAKKSGIIDLERTRKAFDGARGLSMIYPDGTPNTSLSGFLAWRQGKDLKRVMEGQKHE